MQEGELRNNLDRWDWHTEATLRFLLCDFSGITRSASVLFVMSLQCQLGQRIGIAGSNPLEKQLAAESTWSGLQGWGGCAPTCVQQDTSPNRKCDPCDHSGGDWQLQTQAWHATLPAACGKLFWRSQPTWQQSHGWLTVPDDSVKSWSCYCSGRSRSVL